MTNCDFKIYDPMLVGAKPKNYRDILKNEKVIGSVKKDGYFYQLVKENNQVYLFSRTVSKVTGIYAEKIENTPHLKEWAEKHLPNGTVLIGEIYYPGGTSKDVTKVMGCLPDKAIERQANDFGLIHFYLHDILKYNGEDFVLNQVDYSHRYSNLCKYIDIQTPLIPEIEIADCYDNTYIDLEDKAYRLIEQGEEGMVFRTESGLYLPGKRRPAIMWKQKQETDTIDFVISKILEPELDYTGKQIETWPYWMRPSDGAKFQIKPEKGRVQIDDTWIPITKAAYYGWGGSFELSAYDNEGNLVPVGRVSSGITDAMKENAGANPARYIGAVAEIEAMSLDKENHTLRHPRLIRVRDDKDARDCKLEEIFK